MLLLTRLNRDPFYLNELLIAQIEATPDTVITLTTGAKLVVAESPETVIERIERPACCCCASRKEGRDECQ